MASLISGELISRHFSITLLENWCFPSSISEPNRLLPILWLISISFKSMTYCTWTVRLNHAYHIIPIRIPHKHVSMLNNLINQPLLLLNIRRINALLDHTAPMLMTRNRHTGLHHRLENKFLVLIRERIQDLLNHVVSIDILHQLPHNSFQHRYDGWDKAYSRWDLHYLLEGPSAMRIAADRQCLLLDGSNDLGQLVSVALFCDLLA